MSSTKQSVAFFGATGGCTAAALERTIKGNIPCSALVRSPEKLFTLMAARGLDADTVKATCNIVQGNISDISAIKKTILVANGLTSSEPASIIVSGVGGSPRLQWSVIRPVTLDNPTICQFALGQICLALEELNSPAKPSLVVVSTTGLSRKQRDVPVLFLGLYHWLLAVPHEDKRVVETSLERELQSRQHFGGIFAVRPSLLLDGPASSRTRVGFEWFEGQGNGQSQDGPAIGYTITRDSVGQWMFDNAINSSNPLQWSGKWVTLTD